MTQRILPTIVSEEQLLDMGETMIMLGAKSRSTIYRYINKEGLQPVRAGGKLLFQVKDLRTWIDSHKATPQTKIAA